MSVYHLHFEEPVGVGLHVFMPVIQYVFHCFPH